MKVSVVVPCYNEEKTIQTFYDAITVEMEKTNYEFEVIFINDGSKDNTYQIASDICKKDKRIKVIHQKNGGVSGCQQF